MKKLLSLLLAALLCLGCMIPAMAEAPVTEAETPAAVETFPYALDNYKMYFDMLVAGGLGATPVWTAAEDGLSYTVDVAGFGSVLISLDAEGNILSYATEMTASAANSEALGNAFGQLVAMIGMTSRICEDITFLMDSEAQNEYATALVMPLMKLISRINDAMAAPVAETAEVFDDTATFTLAVNLETVEVTFGFIYEP